MPPFYFVDSYFNRIIMNSEWILHAESLHPLLGEAVRAAELGGEVLLRYWQQLALSDIHEKGKGDLVTAADLESEAVITNYLREKIPRASVICEEGTTQTGAETTIYVDPLDGTTNFVQKFPVFAVSIGCVESGNDRANLQWGVVWNPVSNDLYYAAKNCGSFRNGERIRCSDKSKLSDAMLATGFPRRFHDELPAYLTEFADIFPQCRAIRRAGSAALDLCWTAQGIFDGFWEHRLSPWDVAAGAIIVEEAGGMCSDFSGGRDFVKSGNIVGAAAGIHAQLLAIIKAARKE